ncbi:hypothetical protein Sulku_2102 [Sulfuricurvum kujiense DSM 16994]|uniref:DUF4214 domain-containing protein n=1 Tax=Sulfuricurvum kujiense (strain ATCC BAA-921 / DSM 16994 / JCM 11577 / YK-1) TaxID=709032 RepID=E4U2Z8_SULKY|nr:DUF4214 domain-containing protein [Sulfuricurvum kujiense]ADR34762.1 hypothetical protein Sulku_2102 [Sulfuricurvum kujiense DSM 16994]
MPSYNDIAKLYVATFNRAPDAAGLSYWVYDSGLSREGIAQSFFDQPETQTRYPSGTSNTDFVTSIYNNLFNRDPEAAGLAYWVGELDAGRVSRDTAILAFIDGALNTALGQDATILTNKQTVGLDFANHDLNDVNLASTVMDAVGADAATVTLALQLISSVTSTTGTLTYEAVAGTTSYLYNTDYSDSTFADGLDSMHKMIYNADGTVTHTVSYASFGASGWTSEEPFEYTQTWTIQNGKLILMTTAGDHTSTDTLTYVTQSGGQTVYNDAGVERDTTLGTVVDQYNELVVSYSAILSPRSEAELLAEGLVKEVLSGNVSFSDPSGAAAAVPSDAKIQLYSLENSFNTMDGITLNADGSFTKTIYTLGDIFNDNMPISMALYSDVNGNAVWESDGNSIYEPFYLLKDITIGEMQSALPGITLVNGGSYYAGEGVTQSGGVDYEVSAFGSTVDVTAMLGERAASAFIINIHGSGSDQSVTGTNSNDAFMWHGGNDTFDGGSDGGDWGNGGSDFASVNLVTGSSAVQIDSSQPNVISISENGTVRVTVTKNTNGSFDATMASSGDVLHMVNTEVFRLYVTPQNTDPSYNFTIDLVGNQTGTFDAHF